MIANERTCPSCDTPIPTGVPFCPACGVTTPTGEDAPTPQAAPPGTVAPDSRRHLQIALGDGYEVRELIGQGGMGSVYSAWDTRLKRRVAIKLLRHELFASAPLIERFRREARAVAKVRHPNVVPIYAIGEGDGFSYMIMPRIEGETLLDLMKREGQLGIEEVRRILISLAKALHAVHRTGMVHRDLKPANIMIEGDDAHVVLMDFGVAKIAIHGEADLTGTGGVVGTPRYMSPEQAVGDEELDARSDIYVLGVVGYEMLAGRHPADPPVALNLRTIRPDVPRWLSKAITDCLQSTPDQRWGSANDLEEALTRGKPGGAHNRAVLMAVAATTITFGGIATFVALRDGDAGQPTGGMAKTAATPTPPTRPEENEPTPPTAGTLEITPPSRSLAVGESVQFSALVRDTAGNIMDGADVAWESDNPTVLRVTRSGLVTAAAPGSAHVIASSGGQLVQTALTVTVPSRVARDQDPARVEVASVTVSADSGTIVVGGTIQVAAVARSADGVELTGSDVVWRSSDTAVVTVSSDGRITGVGEGSALVSARSDNQSDTVAITVEPVPVASVSVSPPQGAVAVGGSLQLIATTRNTFGNVLPGRTVIWRSSDETVAQVSPRGLVTGVAEGSVNITALSGTGNATVPMTVEAVTSPREAAVTLGQTTEEEIDDALATYRRAIESRDVEALRNIYPGMTAQQEQGWSEFFQDATSLTLELTILDLETSATTALAQVEGVLGYFLDNERHTETRLFVMTLVNGPNGWRFNSVR